MDKETIKNLFLSDSYCEQLKEYNNILAGNKECNWDVIVITASNERQAKIYENQINKRLKYNLLPSDCDYIVIPDKDNKRIGSGGATLNVILELKKKYSNFDDLKILLIHSGGDSKRIPQYSATGKLFSPVPRELKIGFSSTLFDELLILLSMIPLRMGSGMLIICGDALLLFNPLQLDFQYKDLASVSMKAPSTEGTTHGVMVENKDGNITKFLHKCSIEKLEKEGAIVNAQVNIDTGVVYFSNKLLNGFLKITSNNTELLINEETRLNLYGDMLYPFAESSTLDDYLKEPAEIDINENILNSRKLLWELKKSFEYSLMKLSPASFIHFGTTYELYDLMVNNIEKYNSIGWNKITNSTNNESNVCLINSQINNSVFEGLFAENSIINDSILGANVVISNTIINNQEIPSDICLSTLKLDKGYVTRIYGINDNPKNKLEDCYTNLDVSRANKKYNLNLDVNKDLWSQELFAIGQNITQSVDNALILYKILSLNATEDEVILWKSLKKESLYSSFNKSVELDDKEIIVDTLTSRIIDAIDNKNELNELCDRLEKCPYKKELIDNLCKVVEKESLYRKIRIYYILSKIDLVNSDNHYFKIFDSIKELVSSDYLNKNNNFKVTCDEVEIELPIRLNFGGGWSDTPPYCIENGGIVLNVAAKLNNKLPIRVKIEKQKERKLTIESVDLGKSEDFYSSKEIFDCSDPNDSFALVKSAIVISGLISKEDSNLENLFENVNGGVKIITDVKNIPRGSGLGTSSILSGALIKALYKFMNIEKDNYEISDDVLKLEQLMSTGGGWQDQVGGIFPGLKIISTKPSVNQKITVEKVDLSSKFIKEINDRLILINTGQRRLARNLLRDIVSKYISNDKITLHVLKNIQKIAQKQKLSFEKEDLKEFGILLDKHWELIKKMDPDSTNLCIETIIKVIENDVYGKALCGAGGGGFIVAVLKENVTKQDISRKIADVFADTDVKLFEVDVYEEE